MKTYKFSGASDDLVEIVDPDHGFDEIPWYSRGRWKATIYDAATDIGVVVHVKYTKLGTWLVGISQFDDEKPLVWPVRIAQSPDTSYSLQLEVDTPDTAVLTNVSGVS